MPKVIIIGAGGVGNVVAHKCAQLPEIFEEIVLASRTVSKCDAIAKDIEAKQGRTIRTAAIDAARASQFAGRLIGQAHRDAFLSL